MPDFLYTSRADKPDPAMRGFLRALATPPAAPKFPPNPLGLSARTLANIAAWNEAQRKGGSSDGNL